MSLQRERAFSADGPVGRYWLLNCVGFRVEGSRLGPGVVEEVARGDDGGDVLVVSRRVLFRRRTFMVRSSRVASVHPWQETIVLGRRSGRVTRETRRTGAAVRARSAELERRLRPKAHTGAVTAARGLRAGASTTRNAALGFARFLVAVWIVLVELGRRYAPRVREASVSAAKIGLAVAHAYASETWRLLRETVTAVRANLEDRRRPREVEASDAAVSELQERRALDWPIRADPDADGEVGAELEAEDLPRRGVR